MQCKQKLVSNIKCRVNVVMMQVTKIFWEFLTSL